MILIHILDRYVGIVGFLVNFTLGTIGNSLCLVTLTRKNMLKNVSTIYFIGLGEFFYNLNERPANEYVERMCSEYLGDLPTLILYVNHTKALWNLLGYRHSLDYHTSNKTVGQQPVPSQDSFFLDLFDLLTRAFHGRFYYCQKYLPGKVTVIRSNWSQLIYEKTLFAGLFKCDLI